jgi:RNA polymerase sigma-70 factor (ECF subfamily)
MGGASGGGSHYSPSPSLLFRVRARDGDAWHRLLQLYGPLVYSWCRHAGLQLSDATDVGQEVFVAVAQGLAAFRRDRPGDSFRGWLYGITRHKLGDHWRRQAHQPQAEGGSDARTRLAQLEAEESSSSAVEPAENDRRRLRHRALELVRPEFTERTWQAFWRMTVQERSAAEVAAALGMSANAVHIAKSRVLRCLREEFGELLD